MSSEQGFELSPGAAQDITEIWKFIADDNPLSATRVREDILDFDPQARVFPSPGPHPF